MIFHALDIFVVGLVICQGSVNVLVAENLGRHGGCGSIGRLLCVAFDYCSALGSTNVRRVEQENNVNPASLVEKS